MIRPIDANLLKENLLNRLSVRSEEYFLVLERFIRRVIDEQPTVDAVEVVRCKECKYRGEYFSCPISYRTDDEFFCKAGELR